MSLCIIAIETSSDVGTIALSNHGKLLGEIEMPDRRNHSKLLLTSIKELLQTYSIDKKEVDVCAVSKGPGSFTGVRIGVTTAKTLAWALGWKVAGVNSLQVRAHVAHTQAPDAYTHLHPSMDALQGEFFHAVYDRDLNEVQAPCLSTADEFRACELPSDVLSFDELSFQPRAANICTLLALHPHLISDDVHGLSPSYLKKSSAERHHDALENK